ASRVAQFDREKNLTGSLARGAVEIEVIKKMNQQEQLADCRPCAAEKNSHVILHQCRISITKRNVTAGKHDCINQKSGRSSPKIIFRNARAFSIRIEQKFA